MTGAAHPAPSAYAALRAEMGAAGVLIFTGGLADEAPMVSVDASSRTPLFTDTDEWVTELTDDDRHAGRPAPLTPETDTLRM